MSDEQILGSLTAGAMSRGMGRPGTPIHFPMKE
jgi:hypothetical protein